MRVTEGFGQSVVIVLLVATQEEGRGLNINIISKQMKMKASYLRKIARKLVEADLLQSSTSRFSGYQLKKRASEMTLLDIFNAIEGEEHFVRQTDVFLRTFQEIEHDYVQQKLGEVVHLMNDGEREYRQKLASITLEALLPKVNEEQLFSMNWIGLNE